LTTNQFQDLSLFKLPEGARGRPAWFVQLWWIFDAMFVRPTPQIFYAWRRFALRLFGARIGRDVLIRPGVRVTYPWKLVIGDNCWVGDDAIIYNIDDIEIGDHAVVSQEAYLCAGTHDPREISFPIFAAPVVIESECWIAARAFVGPGVRISHGAVVGACSVVQSDVPPATIVAGFPARAIQKRRTRKPNDNMSRS